MAVIKIKIDLKKEETFILSNEDAVSIQKLCFSLQRLENYDINREV